MHLWDTGEPLRGTLVLFHDSFLTGEGGPRSASIARGSSVLRPDLGQLMRCEAILGAMNEQPDLADPQSRTISRDLLSILLLECELMEGTGHVGPIGPAGRLSRDFAALVAEHASARLTVRECAGELGVTAGYLHEVVVAQTGLTPGQAIRAAVLSESRRLLSHADLTCAQIARRVGFDDASYFSRFFRREAAMTPSAFRTRNRPRVALEKSHLHRIA